MMRKLIYLLFMGVAMALVSSCGSTYNLVVDESTPPEKSAVVYFSNNDSEGSFDVLKWNDVDIKERLYGNKKFSGSGEEVFLTIPPGNSRITLDVRFHSKGDRYYSRNAVVEYNFAPGKKYQLKGKVVTEETFFGRTARTYLELYDITSEKNWMQKALGVEDKMVKAWEVPWGLI